MSPKRSIALTGLAITLLLPLGACANARWSESLQRSLAADPRLQENPVSIGAGSSSPTNTTAVTDGATPSQTAQLPANFPAEIPRYPNAELVNVAPGSSDAFSNDEQETQTEWLSPDSEAEVQQFYQDAFRSDGWNLRSPQSDTAAANAEQPAGNLVAERDGLNVTVAVAPSSATAGNSALPAPQTELTISYRLGSSTAMSGTASPTETAQSAPQPGDPEFIGPVPPANWSAQTAEGATASGDRPTSTDAFTDLDQAPEELRQYVADLAQLGVLRVTAASNGDANNAALTSQLKPNQEITRREYARWLVAANNSMYGDRPTRKIRLATASSQPAFQDVPTSDPDFAAIQGLAEAGIIPSSLAGDATTVTFRPNAPLTREELILWKVPIDTRQTLPNATIDAVQQTWGFQDATRIDPRSLRAVLADYQNGDLSNIRRAFSYTTLLQPKKPATRAEAAAVLWYFGAQGDGISANDALQAEQQSTR
ncbi:S-layer homology domain-containing protein [Oculatella sp. LEGE 06141]|uniref:S-layer homology domain-containing protein n=1 Tax=Oculatella sp. LEGE 06141 TaxID=1828648 RepID=UPI00187EB27C|nr:S-layer homology domain-containing protein [Oculatella sp. LEGE 06141]MBE9181384.1 S-layer homology domain-containing protein [Oculatella sp. LEGE 06141]